MFIINSSGTLGGDKHNSEHSYICLILSPNILLKYTSLTEITGFIVLLSLIQIMNREPQYTI